MSYETLPRPKPGKLADAVERLAGDMLNDIASDDDRINVTQSLEMLTTCPVVSAAVEAKILLAIGLWGEYTYENEEIQAYIRENLECMDGSFQNSLAEIYSVSPIGWAASEIAHRSVGVEPAELRLESIMILDPRLYQFRGRRSRIESIWYQSTDKQVAIPYDTKILHVVNKKHLAFGDPCGVADCRIAAAAWQAWKIIVAEALVAGQRQATPIIAGVSGEGDVPLLKPNGDPLLNAAGQPTMVPGTKAMSKALEGLRNNASYLSLPAGSTAQTLNAQTNGQFFMELLEYFQRLMLMSFMVPETLVQVGRGGLGNAGLAEAHQKIMMMQLKQVTKQIKESLIEKVVRPLIEWKYGEQESYGDFAEPEQSEEDKLRLFELMTNAFERGTLSVVELEAINKYRGLVGLSPLTEIIERISPPNFDLPTAA